MKRLFVFIALFNISVMNIAAFAKTGAGRDAPVPGSEYVFSEQTGPSSSGRTGPEAAMTPEIPSAEAKTPSAGTETPSAGTEASGISALSRILPAGIPEDTAAGIPEDASVLVTLKSSEDKTGGELKLYRLSTGTLTQPQEDPKWEEILSADAKAGMNGFGKTVEGDSKTPLGVFKLNTPFGIKKAEEGFPADYLQVDQSCYWVGDSDSPLYNKLVSTDVYSDFDMSKSEHIIDYTGYYDYCLDTGYNPEGTPRLGSAIFLHCSVNGENTHGCVAIPEAAMIEVLRNYVRDHSYIAIF